MTVQGLNTPGTYTITLGGKDTKVQADSLDYNGPDGSLQAYKGGEVIATFRWWDSIIRTGD